MEDRERDTPSHVFHVPFKHLKRDDFELQEGMTLLLTQPVHLVVSLMHSVYLHYLLWSFEYFN